MSLDIIDLGEILSLSDQTGLTRLVSKLEDQGLVVKAAVDTIRIENRYPKSLETVAAKSRGSGELLTIEINPTHLVKATLLLPKAAHRQVSFLVQVKRVRNKSSKEEKHASRPTARTK